MPRALRILSRVSSAYYCLTSSLAKTYILRFGKVHHRQSPRPPTRTTQAALAQLVEHSIRNRKVVGSTPMGGSSKYGRFSKIAETPDFILAYARAESIGHKSPYNPDDPHTSALSRLLLMNGWIFRRFQQYLYVVQFRILRHRENTLTVGC
jgi:hypothetical protein